MSFVNESIVRLTGRDLATIRSHISHLLPREPALAAIQSTSGGKLKTPFTSYAGNLFTHGLTSWPFARGRFFETPSFSRHPLLRTFLATSRSVCRRSREPMTKLQTVRKLALTHSFQTLPTAYKNFLDSTLNLQKQENDEEYPYEKPISADSH